MLAWHFLSHWLQTRDFQVIRLQELILDDRRESG